MFQSLEKKSLIDLEQEILSFWKNEDIFKKSLSQRSKCRLFSFFDGPPFATGLPHYGHLLASTIKDVVARYKTMQGYQVPRRFGWDCHGLPVENEIEKAHNLKGAYDIEQFGVANFNEACRSIVMRYSSEWKATIERIGRWVDFDQNYHTMDLSFMESVWWVFSKLYEKGLVYKGFKVMPFSAKLGTPLSNFEANLNYKEVDDPSIVVHFPLKDDPETSLLVWTTTPWTLVSNLAVCVGEDIEYVKIKDLQKDQFFILARSRLSTYYKNEKDYEVIASLRAIDLKGLHYEPPFDYFKDEPAFKVLIGDFVSADNGTGIVHTAPGFGEDDFYACQKEGIEPVCPVDRNGCYESPIEEYKGQFVQDANKDLIKRLKSKGKLFHQATIHHRYPFCWRTDTPLIYRLTTSWFVSVEKIKEKVIQANQRIYWMPNHIKNGRFGKWLEGARDWAISRNRYWGTPLPIWEAEDGTRKVIGSIDELQKYTGKEINDLHRHFIDGLEFKDELGKTYKRVEEVFDCWFESGSMPYAQMHYPFENQKKFKDVFPADFIAEGLDQTRGWFYTLTVLSAALFDGPAFKNVVVNGIILAEDGQKMSKRLKNYPDPNELLEQYGADAIRLYMLHSPVVRADDMRFQKRGVEQIFRQTLLPLWNSYNFFVSYANIYDWNPDKQFKQPEQLLDCWIFSLFQKLVNQVESAMDQYNLNAALTPIVDFIEQLTNWYIRRSRRRFWNSEACDDRDEAFSTLYFILKGLCKMLAPFAPFLTETLYQNLKRKSHDAQSVHLCDSPVYHPDLRDLDLEKKMEALQRTVSQGHALRKEHKMKVRQPLSKLHVAVGDELVAAFLEDQSHLICEELNVKTIEFYSDESRLVSLKLIPNFRVLGKKVGPLMKEVQKELAQLDPSVIQVLSDEGQLELVIQGEALTIDTADVQIKREVKEGLVASNEEDITVALDLELTDELISEGIAREIVNKIQTMRRDADLDKTDRIQIQLKGDQTLSAAFDKHRDYIIQEVLATKTEWVSELDSTTKWDINGLELILKIDKDSALSPQK